jgi:hypothetical protein
VLAMEKLPLICLIIISVISLGIFGTLTMGEDIGTIRWGGSNGMMGGSGGGYPMMNNEDRHHMHDECQDHMGEHCDNMPWEECEEMHEECEEHMHDYCEHEDERIENIET